MSKLRYSAILSLSAAGRPLTYLVEPTMPNSSAVQKQKRTAFWTRNWESALATSMSAISPDPLSLIPGPAPTESVWAPSTMVLLWSPHVVSIMRFVLRIFTGSQLLLHISKHKALAYPYVVLFSAVESTVKLAVIFSTFNFSTRARPSA